MSRDPLRRPVHERSAKRGATLSSGVARAVAERVAAQLVAAGLPRAALHVRSSNIGGEAATLTFTLKVGAARLMAEIEASSVDRGGGLGPADSLDAWRLTTGAVVQLLAAAVNADAAFTPAESEAA